MHASYQDEETDQIAKAVEEFLDTTDVKNMYYKKLSLK